MPPRIASPSAPARLALALVPLALAACSDNVRFGDGATGAPADATLPPGDGAAPDARLAPDALPPGAVCFAGQARCNPDALDTTQRCADDGMSWVDGASCDGAQDQRCVDGVCVRPCAAVGDSYLGCEYWPTTTPNGMLAAPFEYAVALANTQRYPVDVRVEGGALTAPVARRVMPGAVELVRLPWIYALSQNTGACCGPPFNTPNRANCAARSARAAAGAFHLRANGPIAAYQFNPLQYRAGTEFSFTNDASLLLPQNTLGRQYLVMAYANQGPPFGAMTDRCAVTTVRGGYVTIVGAQADAGATNTVRVRTTTAVWDPADMTRTLPAGEHTFEIARGEALQLVSQGYGADLTGTYVEASAPVAVYSGHECTTVPGDRPACDHIEEQLFPLAAWGRTYAVSPVMYRGARAESSVVRVMAQRDGVMLVFDGITAPASCQRVLMRGQFCELETDRGFKVIGSAPIAVAQYLRGLGDVAECQCAGATCPDGPECRGDPALVLEPPVDQYRRTYRFLVPDTYVDNFVNVVGPADANIRLDGNTVTGDAIPTGAGLVTRIARVAPGAHEISSADGMTRFGIKVYGVAPFTSYAYPGGLDLAPIAPP